MKHYKIGRKLYKLNQLLKNTYTNINFTFIRRQLTTKLLKKPVYVLCAKDVYK